MVKKPTNIQEPNPKKALAGTIYLWLLAALLAFLPLIVFVLMRHIVSNQQEGRFAADVAQLRGAVQQNVEVLGESLDAARGLFAASKSVERDEWKAFTDRLELEHERPGVMQIRFIQRVPEAHLQEFIDSVRNDQSIQSAGYPNFKIFPEGLRAEYFPIKYLNPDDGNMQIMGLDMGVERVRRQALERAASTDQAVSTPPVRWLDSPTGKWVVVFLAPIYRNGESVVDEPTRLKNLFGFVGIVVDIEAFFSSTLSKSPGKKLAIYSRLLINKEESPVFHGAPIFDNRPPAFRAGEAFQFVRRSTVVAAGREWRLEYFADSDFGLTRVQFILPFVAAAGGLLVGALIFWIILLARSSRDQAYSLARRMTHDLEESRERLLQAQIAAGFGTWDWDIRTNRVICTEELEYIHGLPKGSIHTMDDLKRTVLPEDTPMVEKALKDAIDDKGDFAVDFRGVRPSGISQIVSVRAKVYRDVDGKPVRMVGIAMDVTERKKIESQLLQSQKMETVGTLAGGIAHDLNNQLSPLLGYVDLILQQTPTGSSEKEMLEEAALAGQRCADIVKRLLYFSRPSTQHKESVAFKKILDETKRVLFQFLPTTIRMEFVCEEPLGLVWANETEIQTVFMNLAANARDVMPEGGRILVRAHAIDLDRGSLPAGRQEGRYLHCSFQDSGSGMTPEVLARIFEPFFSTKEKSKGTGLGLSMVFNIIRDHGGWLDVSSKPGTGTTFQIYLPSSDKSAPSSAAARAADGSEELAKGTGEILFADDEEYMRNLGKTFLKRLGYTPVLVASGPEAVERFRANPTSFVAVVMDMTMPGQTGVQTIRQLLEINSKTRILVASGHTSEGTPDELLSAGAREFLAKPYTIQLFAKAIQRVMAV